MGNPASQKAMVKACVHDLTRPCDEGTQSAYYLALPIIPKRKGRRCGVFDLGVMLSPAFVSSDVDSVSLKCHVRLMGVQLAMRLSAGYWRCCGLAAILISTIAFQIPKGAELQLNGYRLEGSFQWKCSEARYT